MCRGPWDTHPAKMGKIVPQPPSQISFARIAQRLGSVHRNRYILLSSAGGSREVVTSITALGGKHFYTLEALLILEKAIRLGEGKWSDLILKGENLQGFKAPTSTKELNHTETVDSLLVFTQWSREMSALPWGLRDRRVQLVVKEMDKSIWNTKDDDHTQITQMN